MRTGGRDHDIGGADGVFSTAVFFGEGLCPIARVAPDTDFREVADMSERLEMRACLLFGAKNGGHFSGEGRVATAETAAVRILVFNSPR